VFMIMNTDCYGEQMVLDSGTIVSDVDAYLSPSTHVTVLGRI